MPPPDSNPLAFVSSGELADELVRRHNACVIAFPAPLDGEPTMRNFRYWIGRDIVGVLGCVTVVKEVAEGRLRAHLEEAENGEDPDGH